MISRGKPFKFNRNIEGYVKNKERGRIERPSKSDIAAKEVEEGRRGCVVTVRQHLSNIRIEIGIAIGIER